MKVYIGNYTFRWVSNVHENYMDWKYGRNNWEDNHNKFESALEGFEDFLQAVYNLTINKYLDRHQRTIRVRIDPADTWSMDHTLAHIIVPMLKQLKATKHGVAMVDMEDVPEILRIEDDAEEIEWLERRWNWAMEEMIWAFEQKTRDDWMDDYYEFADEHKLGDEPSRWDGDGMKAHQDRMTNGFRLFGKYYEGLWD
jgi:hypothetical protein